MKNTPSYIEIAILCLVYSLLLFLSSLFFTGNYNLSFKVESLEIKVNK
jgi:hypothetical protein